MSVCVTTFSDLLPPSEQDGIYIIFMFLINGLSRV